MRDKFIGGWAVHCPGTRPVYKEIVSLQAFYTIVYWIPPPKGHDVNQAVFFGKPMRLQLVSPGLGRFAYICGGRLTSRTRPQSVPWFYPWPSPRG